jgi:hypothetical protein
VFSKIKPISLLFSRSKKGPVSISQESQPYSILKYSIISQIAKIPPRISPRPITPLFSKIKQETNANALILKDHWKGVYSTE